MSLELTVTRIQKLLDPLSTVQHDVSLEDYRGEPRQFDVVIRGTFGGRPVLGVVECKDHKRKTGVENIEAFSKKCESVGANVRVFVSRMGFTKHALVLARDYKIDCLSVLDDPHRHGIGFGTMSYARQFYWAGGTLMLQVEIDGEDQPLTGLVTEATFQGDHIANFFIHQLNTKFESEEREGDLTFTISLHKPLTVQLFGSDRIAKRIEALFHRKIVMKRRWHAWIGDGYFDWQTSSIQLAGNGGQVVSSPIPLDLTEWEQFDGDVPSGPLLTTVVSLYPKPSYLCGTGVPPLNQYGTLEVSFKSKS